MLTPGSGTLRRPDGAAGLHPRLAWCIAFGILGLLFVLLSLPLRIFDPEVYDGRRAIDLTARANPDQYLMPRARMATDELCDEALPCDQAVDSDTVVLRRFDTRAEAAAAAARIGGDARLAGWIVIEYEPGGLDDDERAEFAGYVYCTHVMAGPC